MIVAADNQAASHTVRILFRRQVCQLVVCVRRWVPTGSQNGNARSFNLNMRITVVVFATKCTGNIQLQNETGTQVVQFSTQIVFNISGQIQRLRMRGNFFGLWNRDVSNDFLKTWNCVGRGTQLS